MEIVTQCAHGRLQKLEIYFLPENYDLNKKVNGPWRPDYNAVAVAIETLHIPISKQNVRKDPNRPPAYQKLHHPPNMYY